MLHVFQGKGNAPGWATIRVCPDCLPPVPTYTTSAPMTKQQFDFLVARTRKERFSVKEKVGPLTHGILRREFERSRLRKLIAAGESVKGSDAVAQKVELWKRRLAKLGGTKKSLASLRKEIKQSELKVISAFPKLINSRRARPE